MRTLNLFDVTYPNHGGNEQSTQAHSSIKNLSEAQRQRILKVIEKAGSIGATCDELERLTNLSHQACSARCSELLALRKVYRNGVLRKTRSGRNAAVLVAV